MSNAAVILIILLLLGAIGHVILWVALINRAHALGISRRWIDLMTWFCIGMAAVMPLLVFLARISVLVSEPTLGTTLFYAAACTYVLACAVVSVIAAVQRLLWRFHKERKAVLVSNHTAIVEFAGAGRESLISPGLATWLNRIPGNEVLRIHVQDKRVIIPRLLPQHEGLRIAHLTDLHMSGRMSKAFYEHVVDLTNRCEADLIAITGDIVDRESCLDWIPDVLGRLRAPYGVFYVLGNHDRRVDQKGLKMVLAKTGWHHVGQQPRPLAVRGLNLLLGGNERPWHKLSTDFSSEAPRGESGPHLRIALSHSPDQLGWACANDVDLILAGHVHGGQICLPGLGAFTAPSLHGVRYAAGTFRVENTVMHVSRGTASLTPIRWNCPPEIAVLHLVSPSI
jgi:predicted MPP superfamily phosphohydrolase